MHYIVSNVPLVRGQVVCVYNFINKHQYPCTHYVTTGYIFMELTELESVIVISVIILIIV